MIYVLLSLTNLYRDVLGFVLFILTYVREKFTHFAVSILMSNLSLKILISIYAN